MFFSLFSDSYDNPLANGKNEQVTKVLDLLILSIVDVLKVFVNEQIFLEG